MVALRVNVASMPIAEANRVLRSRTAASCSRSTSPIAGRAQHHLAQHREHVVGALGRRRRVHRQEPLAGFERPAHQVAEETLVCPDPSRGTTDGVGAGIASEGVESIASGSSSGIVGETRGGPRSIVGAGVGVGRLERDERRRAHRPARRRAQSVLLERSAKAAREASAPEPVARPGPGGSASRRRTVLYGRADHLRPALAAGVIVIDDRLISRTSLRSCQIGRREGSASASAGQRRRPVRTEEAA